MQVPGEDDRAGVDVSVLAPAHNERDNVRELALQVHSAMTPTGLSWEFVLVNDGSTDGTAELALETAEAEGWDWLRVVSMTRTPPGRGNGQSAAFHAGFRAARGRLIATLDADLQNAPSDIPKLIAEMERTGADFVQGDRSAARRQGDHAIRQFGSLVGRKFRKWLLGDTIRDTGCSLRVMKREIALRIPLEFKGMHRFIPVTARQLGYTVVEMPVEHRSRHAGEPKYGMGITKRAIPGLIDCLAVRWMSKRRQPTSAEETRLTGSERTGAAEHRSAPEPAGVAAS